MKSSFQHIQHKGGGATISPGEPDEYLSGEIAWKSFPTAVRNSELLGLPALTNTPILESDSLLTALAKLQGQINVRPMDIGTKGLWVNKQTGSDVTGVRGSFFYPFASIQAAVNNAQNGDTIHIAFDTYNERVIIPATLNGAILNINYDHGTIHEYNGSLGDGSVWQGTWIGNANPGNITIGLRIRGYVTIRRTGSNSGDVFSAASVDIQNFNEISSTRGSIQVYAGVNLNGNRRFKAFNGVKIETTNQNLNSKVIEADGGTVQGVSEFENVRSVKSWGNTIRLYAGGDTLIGKNTTFESTSGHVVHGFEGNMYFYECTLIANAAYIIQRRIGQITYARNTHFVNNWNHQNGIVIEFQSNQIDSAKSNVGGTQVLIHHLDNCTVYLKHPNAVIARQLQQEQASDNVFFFAKETNNGYIISSDNKITAAPRFGFGVVHLRINQTLQTTHPLSYPDVKHKWRFEFSNMSAGDTLLFELGTTQSELLTVPAGGNPDEDAAVEWVNIWNNSANEKFQRYKAKIDDSMPNRVICEAREAWLYSGSGFVGTDTAYITVTGNAQIRITQNLPSNHITLKPQQPPAVI